MASLMKFAAIFLMSSVASQVALASDRACKDNTVSCYDYGSGHLVTHVGYDSCDTYYDYGKQRMESFPYCSKSKRDPCAGDTAVCYDYVAGRMASYPGYDSCDSYYDYGLGHMMSRPICSKD